MDLRQHTVCTILVMLLVSGLDLCAASFVVARSSYAILTFMPLIPINVMVVILSVIQWKYRERMPQHTNEDL